MKQILVLSLLCLTGCYPPHPVWDRYVFDHSCKVVDVVSFTDGFTSKTSSPEVTPLLHWKCDTEDYYRF